MSHTHLTDTEREQAALYALGALDADETHAFRAHLDTGCQACAVEVAAFTLVAGDLAVASTPTTPPPQLRARVLDRVARAAKDGFYFRLADEGSWREVAPGVARRELGPSSFLIRMLPGSRLHEHRHEVTEHCYVLDGDLLVNERRLRSGDYHEARPGTLHEGLVTERGCTFLVVESPDASV